MSYLERRLHVLIGAILAASFVVFAGIGYISEKAEAERDLMSSAERVRAVLMATRRIYHHQFIDSGLPLTEKTIGFLPAHALNRISKDLANWDSSGFSFNNVSDKPRNPNQKADALEMMVIGYFRDNPSQEVYFAPFTNENGDLYYEYARPIWVEKYCLECHGEKEKAPETIRKLYDTAYGYHVGDLRGILSIKVPARMLQQRLWQGFAFNLAWVGCTLVLLWVAIAFVVRRDIMRPLGALRSGIDALKSGAPGGRAGSGALPGELGEVGREFDAMAEALAAERTRLEFSEERFRKLASAATDAIVVSDEDDRIQFWNRGAQMLFGHDADAIIGQPVMTIIPERFRSAHIAGMERLRQGERGVHFDHPIEAVGLHNDGREIPVELSLNMWMQNGRKNFVGIIRDIRERKVAESALLQSNKDLEQFAYVASHDLQTPIRNIVSYAQLLDRRYKGHIDADADQFLDFIVNSSKQMSRLIAGLLEFSRAGRVSSVTAAPASAAVAQALANLRPLLEDSGAAIEVGDLPVVMAEEAHLASLFQNLISNAIKYRSPDRRLRVTVTAERSDGDLWRFAVADNGIGIEAAYHEKIFEIFQRLAPSPTEGSGIGLTLCQRIVQRFGGRIWLESTPGVGTTFFFTLRGSADGEG